MEVGFGDKSKRGPCSQSQKAKETHGDIFRAKGHRVFAPSLARVPSRLARATVRSEKLTFDIFTMTVSERDELPGSNNTPWARLEGILQDVASASGDQVEVEEHVISLADCDLCALALAKARRPSSFDSSELHLWLSHFHREQWAGHRAEEGATSTDVVASSIPIFIYELEATEGTILLDGKHRAMAFDDMVVAVVNKGANGVRVNGGVLGEGLEVSLVSFGAGWPRLGFW